MIPEIRIPGSATGSRQTFAGRLVGPGAVLLIGLGLVLGCGPSDTPVGIEVALPPDEGVAQPAPGGGGTTPSVPTIVSVSPDVGTTAGLNTVVITGSGFNSSASATIGGATAGVTFVNSGRLDVVVPANPNPGDVQVQVVVGSTAAIAPDPYTYVTHPDFRQFRTATGTFTLGGELVAGLLDPIADPSGNLDVAYVEMGGVQLGAATGDGAGGLTENAAAFVAIPLVPAASAIRGLSVATIGGSFDGIAVADASANQVRVLSSQTTSLDTQTLNAVPGGPLDVVLDSMNARAFILKSQPALEVHTIADNVGTLTGPTMIGGGSGTSPSGLSLGRRDGEDVLVVSDSGATVVRVIPLANLVATQVQVTILADRVDGILGASGLAAIANNATGTVEVVAPVAGQTIRPALTVGAALAGMRVGDINQDNRADIVVSVPSIGEVQAFLNGGVQSGVLRFSGPTRVGPGTLMTPGELLLADLNRDSRVDVVVFTSGGATLTILLQGI